MADVLSTHPLCVGKQVYETRSHAAKVVRSMRRFGKTTEVYKCHACGDWHVGRPPRVKNNR